MGLHQNTGSSKHGRCLGPKPPQPLHNLKRFVFGPLTKMKYPARANWFLGKLLVHQKLGYSLLEVHILSNRNIAVSESHVKALLRRSLRSRTVIIGPMSRAEYRVIVKQFSKFLLYYVTLAFNCSLKYVWSYALENHPRMDDPENYKRGTSKGKPSKRGFFGVIPNIHV